MSEKVKGHFRRGVWIGPYIRHPKDRSTPPGDEVLSRDMKWKKEFHDCCEGILCCACERKLGLDEIEPVGMGQERWHRYCGACTWETFGGRFSSVGKYKGTGGGIRILSPSGVVKNLHLLDMQESTTTKPDGE